MRIIAILSNSINKCTEYFEQQNLYYNQIVDEIKTVIVTFSKYIIKKEAFSPDFDEIIKIPFETKKNKEILAGQYSPAVDRILVSEQEFEEKCLRKFDSVKNLIDQMESTTKNQMITASIKFVYFCLRNFEIKLPYNNDAINICQVIFCEGDFDTEK